MPHDNCPYINELYQNWSSLVSQLESLKNRYIREGSKELEEEFNLLKEKVKKAKERYLIEMERVVEYDNEEIFLKDAIILEYLRERVEGFNWGSDNKRATSINLSDKEIPPEVKYFPNGLQELYLNSAKIENSEKLNFPDGLQWLSLSGAKIENPEKLNLPDSLQWLSLFGAKIENPENLKLPDGLQELYLDNAKIENPENLRLPDGLQWLSLSGAKIENPEKLNLPDSLEVLFLRDIKITKELEEMLDEYKKRNSNVNIVL